MKIKSTLIVVLLSLAWGVISSTAALPLAAETPAAPAVSITSTYTSTPPRIDGVIDPGEWNLANKVSFPDGFATVLNDGLRLYVLLDVTGDTYPDTGDYFWLTFDVNRDSAITPNVDVNYGTSPSNGNIRYQYYLGAGSWTGLQPNTFSSRASGFGCYWADGTFSVTFAPFTFQCSRHRVWELAIDLSEIGTSAGSSARMGVRAASVSPAFTDDTPANFSSSFSNLINVSLAASPGFTVAPLSGANVGFESNSIEVTQAVQNRSNTLPLVAGKSTVARVYALTTNVPSPQTEKVYLYGSVGGVDLPGSPLATSQWAPTVITRSSLDDTANFALPKSWTMGMVTFSAKSVDSSNHKAATTPFNLTFTSKAVPTYWVVPINTGTSSSPVVPSNAEIASQESYLKAVYPLRDVNFVQKSWTVVGPTTVGDTIAALNNYYNATFVGWAISFIFTGKVPFTLPDQIYGLTPSGGGISDPVWIGGAGRVARGYRGSSLEGTMAHEINHNLDRSVTGTWGHHVPNGCGAAGPDPNWPYANSNVNEVGFDTRLPWSASGTTHSVVPSTYPDLMSYCQSGNLPTKWISPYRWTNLYNNFAAGSGPLAAKGVSAAQTVYYLSGKINRDGTGTLSPVFVQPGISTPNPSQGEYILRLVNKSAGTFDVFTFPIAFLDDPEEPVNTAYFNFQAALPRGFDPAALSSIRLMRGTQVLDQINVSAHAPTVNITAPTAGAEWSGTQNVQWTANDLDGDPLTFMVLYSPDGGQTWLPVAANVHSTSLPVDTATLPGSTNAKFRVIATDGLNTGQADSAIFTVARKPPTVAITLPHPNDVVPPGNPVILQGDANDPEDGALPETSIMWKEGSAVIGSGRNASVVLSPGNHTITLAAFDSDGNLAQTNVQVLVGARLYLPYLSR
ncbi:MAG: hypothetical protein M1132_10115 [Chloroflexi bacterium]|nr:hypothetical protein [Chloroflexota bacterium]